ncbi:MAG: cupin domain-containing protein [Pirellulales bacterium]|nr:cupin domain-containing protein [Pirellulales bacterium]
MRPDLPSTDPYRSDDGVLVWLRLPLIFDATKMSREVSKITDSWWVPHFNQGDYRGGWSATPLRAPAEETHPIRMVYPDPGANRWHDTEILEQCPTTRTALSQLKCPVRSARLMRLAAGAEIFEHTDHELGYEDGEVRLHVPILTSAEVEFWLAGSRIEMQPGEMWYLNVNLPHRVSNRSRHDRIHLVVDCLVNPWLTSLFSRH